MARVKVIYKLDNQRKNHYMIADEMGDGWDGMGNLYFSLRPLAGTQELPRRNIISIEPLSSTVSLRGPTIIRNS